MLNNKCLGCGTLKQTSDNNALGYVIDLSHKYCLDCFKLKNYGIVKDHVHPDKFPEIKPNSVVLVIQSIMQLDLLFMQPITRIQPNAKYIYIINQTDLLPKDTNLDFIYDNIVKNARKNKIKYFDIIFMSAINKNDINNLSNYLFNLKEKEIYLFGIQNSGKSTIFKGITNNEEVLSINKAGLTQDIISEVINGKIIYDMPGTYFGGYLHDFLEYNEYKKLIPNKMIKPKIYQMRKEQSIVLENFISVTNFLESTTFVFYLNSNTKTNKYNYKNSDKYLIDKYDYITKDVKVGIGKHQITFGDLGFLVIEGPNTIKVKTPKQLHVSTIEAYLK